MAKNKIIIQKDIREMIVEKGANDIWQCYQCGKCMGLCPLNLLENIQYPTYQVSQLIKLGALLSSEDPADLDKEVNEIFRCLNCYACRAGCPRGVDLPKINVILRQILNEFNSIPKILKPFIARVLSLGNPSGEAREKRADWAKDLEIPKFEKGMEYLYLSCCLPAYDLRLQKVAQATVKILKQAKVSFGILGEKEYCCGEAIKKIGAEKVWQEAVKINLNNWLEEGVKKILVTSPHCYNTFKNDYPGFKNNFEIFHTCQIFSQLIKEKRIIPTKSFDKIVIYHDPCTLGRQNGIFEEPREVLKSIPGLKLKEVKNFSYQDSVCCGGGAGGLWLDWPPDERITNFRLKQFLETGAEIIAVTCPYCLSMFESGITQMNLNLQVLDLAEILAKVI